MTRRALQMLPHSICPNCMGTHPAPPCAWLCDAPCPECERPIGLLSPGMDGTRCWRCHAAGSAQ